MYGIQFSIPSTMTCSPTFFVDNPMYELGTTSTGYIRLRHSYRPGFKDRLLTTRYNTQSVLASGSQRSDRAVFPDCTFADTTNGDGELDEGATGTVLAFVVSL